MRVCVPSCMEGIYLIVQLSTTVHESSRFNLTNSLCPNCSQKLIQKYGKDPLFSLYSASLICEYMCSFLLSVVNAIPTCPLGLWSNARYCEYYGMWYCTQCHQDHKSFVPARVVHFWDFAAYGVCNEAMEHILEGFNMPILTVTDPNSKVQNSLQPVKVKLLMYVSSTQL